MGNPIKYQADELEKAVDSYFRKIQAWTVVKDEAGEVVRDLDGEEMRVIQFRVPPSIPALCVQLKITPQTWSSYARRGGEYTRICQQAKLIIEAYLYEQLNTRKHTHGIIFNLQNNYGMAEQHKIEATSMSLTDRMDLIRKAASLAEEEEHG